jgi:hypothetical protein
MPKQSISLFCIHISTYGEHISASVSLSDWFHNRECLLRGTNEIFKCNLGQSSSSRPYQGSRGSASRHGCPRSKSASLCWYFWTVTWQWGWFIWQYLGFPHSTSFHHSPIHLNKRIRLDSITQHSALSDTQEQHTELNSHFLFFSPHLQGHGNIISDLYVFERCLVKYLCNR